MWPPWGGYRGESLKEEVMKGQRLLVYRYPDP